MFDNTVLPAALSASIGSENKDFAVKAGRAQPLKQSLWLLLFGVVWLGFSSLMFFVFFGPILKGEEIHFTSNAVPTVAGPGNLEPLLMPGIVIGLFMLIGIVILVIGMYLMFRKGGYFVGTPTRLVHFKKGHIRSIDWEQFSGDISVSGNAQKGDITLGMRTGQMVSQEDGPDRYVPHIIYIAAIPNAFAIERICRKRIKENDPTPPSNSY